MQSVACKPWARVSKIELKMCSAEKKAQPRFSMLDSVLKPLTATFVMYLTLLFLRRNLLYDMRSVWILVGTGLVVYLAVIFALFGYAFVEDVKKAINSFFKK